MYFLNNIANKPTNFLQGNCYKNLKCAREQTDVYCKELTYVYIYLHSS